MKQYTRPEASLVLLESTDVITASDGLLTAVWDAASGLKFSNSDFWDGSAE